MLIFAEMCVNLQPNLENNEYQNYLYALSGVGDGSRDDLMSEW